MTQELVVVIMPSGALELEWAEENRAEKIDKKKQRLQQEIHKRFQENFSSALLFLGFSDKDIPLSNSLDFWRDFTSVFTKKLTQVPDLEEIREKVTIPLEEKEITDLLQRAPFMTGAEHLDDALLEFLWSRLQKQFQQEIWQYDGSVASFVNGYSPELHILGRVYFHLVENKNDEEFPFAFLATYSTKLSEEGNSKHVPLKYALEEYGDNERNLLDLLTTVQLAANDSDLIADLLDEGEIFHPLAWTAQDAFQFLKEIPIYENAGILCRIPDWWKNKSSSLRVNITVGDSSPSHVGMDALLNFNVNLLLGEDVITEEEIRAILAQSEGLAYIKGKWVEVNSQKLHQVLQLLDKTKRKMGEDLSIREALRLQLEAKENDKSSEGIIDISHGKWLKSVIDKLHAPELIKSIKPGKDFKATLRPYQQKGLNWLYFLHSLQFGACLADDMGLGKTVQVLAFLNILRRKKSKVAHLLVVPATLMSNWQKEAKNFAPLLKCFVAHPSENPTIRSTIPSRSFLNGYDVIITTYALAHKYPWFKKHTWNYIILDEAQAIKNPATKQTKIVKSLKSYNKIILTGTPIENKLGDLWSLYDFINPGLLGSTKEFTDYSKQLKNSPKGYKDLRQIITPYLLRRLKTDKTIISDLPDKIEMKTYCSLSKKQIFLYEKLVTDIKYALENLSGIKRRGIILGSLMKFKQICNHPGQYLGNQEFAQKDSGKLVNLREISETILEKREKVLIFTQFKEIIEQLHAFLADIFGREGLVLHGSISVAKRKKIVERFQSKEYIPFLILSVKAGGVGLNLTEANHVIHFDRWWNPAVENQATDRAFRIGQNKKVLVHKFITKGTIEEKIDAMLEEKAALTKEIIPSSGEKWITEMSNNEILDLFTLSL